MSNFERHLRREGGSVKLTNQAMLAASEALLAASEALSGSKTLSGLLKVRRPMMGTMMKMRRIARALAAQAEDYEAQRRELLEAHGDHDAEERCR